MADEKKDAAKEARQVQPEVVSENPKKMPPIRVTPLKSAFVPKASGMDVAEKDKPSFAFSLLHDNHVVLTWLLQRINALDDAEEIRFSLLIAAEKSEDERLHKVVDELKAYIKAREQ